MPLSPERLAQIKAATADISVKPSDAGSSTGTIGEFLRSRSESVGHDSSVFNIGGELLTNLKSRVNKASEAAYGGDTSVPERILRVAGQTAGAVGDVVGAGLKTAYQVAVPEAGKKELRRIGRDILDSDLGQAGMDALHKGIAYWDEFAKNNPNAAEDIKSVVDIASILPAEKVIGAGVKAASAVGRAGVKTAETLAQGARFADDAFTAGKDALRGLKKGLTPAIEKDVAETAAKSVVPGAERTAADLAAETAARAPKVPDVIPDTATPPSAIADAAIPKAPLDIPSVPEAPPAAAFDAATPPIPKAAAPITPEAPPIVPKTPATPISAAEQMGEKVGRFAAKKAEGAGRAVRGASERFKPNVAAKKAEEAAYKALAPEGQKAVRSGVLRRDVEDFATANPTEKGILQRMAKAAEEVTDGRGGKIHPSEIAGEQMNKRIKLLDDERKTIGKELGEHVKGLKTKDIGGIEQVQNDVVNRLNDVPGLEGIKTKIGEGGKVELDFSDTAMRGSQTANARKELQDLFDDMNNATPYQLHRQRQEIFESLGGKKAAQLHLTETQEQGMDAIREGIADSLERVSKGYKDLNSQYRQVVTPLKEIRKFFKGTEGATQDVLDEKAGLLMRRLTSNVPSRPELERILDDISAQLTKRGHDVSDVDLNKLQHFYNALNRYYDISNDSSFEGLIKSANANPTDFSKTGIVKKVVDSVAKNTYITKDTQRAALKELIGH